MSALLHPRKILPLAALAAAVFASGAWMPPAVMADGFHSSFLSKKNSPKQWWEYHRHEYVTLEKPTQVVTGAKNEGEPAVFKKKAVAGEDVQLRRKALIATLMKHLMYLNVANVNPSEFPDFRDSYVPEYMRTFKDILVELGSETVPFLLDAYMGTLLSDAPFAGELTRNPQFMDDIVEVLQRIGKASVPSIAAHAAVVPAGRSRDILIGLIAKILKNEPELKFVPGMLDGALANWKVEGPRLLATAREGAVAAAARTHVFRIWMAVSFRKADPRDPLDALRDRSLPVDLRGEAIDFLAEKGHAPAAPDFLRIAGDPGEELSLRQSAAVGLWSLHLLCPSMDTAFVRGDLGLKTRIASPEERASLRTLLLYLLVNLEDASLLETLVLLLNRGEDDQGVRMAALDAAEKLFLAHRAAVRVDREVLLRPDAIPPFRLRLLDLLCADPDRANAPVLVRILLSETEPLVLRVRAMLALKKIPFPGFGRAEALLLERTRLQEGLRKFLLDPTVSEAERAPVVRDMETLVSLQAEGLARAVLSVSMRQVALGEVAVPPDTREFLVRLLVRVQGKESLPLLQEVLESPSAAPGVKEMIARWAGETGCRELLDALRKAKEGARETLLSAALLDALERLGETVDPREVWNLLVPKSGKPPDQEVLGLALPLLGRIGDRAALSYVVRWVLSPAEGVWSVSALALRVLGESGEEGRPLFPNVWETFLRTELGNPECRTAFLDCFLKMGPSREIAEFLLTRMRIEIQRAPLSPLLPPAGGPPGEAGEVRGFLPALHAFLLLHAYWKNSTALPDVSQAMQLSTEISTWYAQTGRNAMPKK